MLCRQACLQSMKQSYAQCAACANPCALQMCDTATYTSKFLARSMAQPCMAFLRQGTTVSP